MGKANDFVHQWGVFGKTMIFYRWIALFSVILAVMVLVIKRHEIVVLKECGEKFFYRAVREEVNIEGGDVERFARNFIKELYKGGYYECMMASGLRKKWQRRKVSQYVGDIKVTLKEKATLVSFDLIVRIKNVPIVVAKNAELQIVQGKKSPCTPLGLYVNGIKEKGVQ